MSAAEDRLTATADEREQFPTPAEAWEYLLADYDRKFPGWEPAQREAEFSELAKQVAQLPPEDRERLDMAERLLRPLEELEAGEGFAFEDIAEVMAGEIKPPATMVEHLIYEHRVHWLAGHPGHGKTTLAMHVAKRVMEAGRHVIWLDWEAGTHPTAARLRAVGVTAKLAREYFHLAASPVVDSSEEGFRPIERALSEWPGALVVFDSASKALSVAGADENSSTDATRWTTNIVMPVREHGGTAVVIDHVTKGATRTTPYARGAGSKLADTDAFWYVERRVPFSREQVGSIELHRHKDRDGVLPETVAFEVGDGRGGLPLRETEVSEHGESAASRDSAQRARVLAVLAEHSSAEEPLSSKQVEGLTQGKGSAIREALKELAADPASPAQARPGPHNAVLYWHDPGAVNAPAI